METDFNSVIEEICESDSRYRVDAYEFVMEALTYTQKKFKCAKHVSGETMLKGMKDLLMDKYGPMTLMVLEYWGIKNTEDFGNVVFNLVEKKILSKTDDDRIEHFQDAYDFEEVFDRGYRKKLAKKISRMRSM